ncbi:transthyretin family protein [Burkholderia pseudomallei 1258a]|nr:transthyretin family protein [Burkholderia pseudomallei 1258a]EIF70127.1 transthyretin family protein [Burkholderia pseudomallei 354e]EIF81632.1 transthyretin family protein [Burkholderia pseudomallei 354a]
MFERSNKARGASPRRRVRSNALARLPGVPAVFGVRDRATPIGSTRSPSRAEHRRTRGAAQAGRAHSGLHAGDMFARRRPRRRRKCAPLARPACAASAQAPAPRGVHGRALMRRALSSLSLTVCRSNLFTMAARRSLRSADGYVATDVEPRSAAA